MHNKQDSWVTSLWFIDHLFSVKSFLKSSEHLLLLRLGLWSAGVTEPTCLIVRVDDQSLLNSTRTWPQCPPSCWHTEAHSYVHLLSFGTAAPFAPTETLIQFYSKICSTYCQQTTIQQTKLSYISDIWASHADQKQDLKSLLRLPFRADCQVYKCMCLKCILY